MQKIYIATTQDKENFKNNGKFTNLIDTKNLSFIDILKLLDVAIDESIFINMTRTQKAIKIASKLGEISLEERKDSADKILKSALLQINNYLMYESKSEFYNSKNHINSIRFLSSIAFSHIKGHYLLNGNKRIAFVFLTLMLQLFGYIIQDVEKSWKQIYDEWKIIAALPGSNREDGINKIYNLVLNNIIKKKRD